MNEKRLIFLLRIACIALLVGWAWLHLEKGGPYRAFFLNDYITRGFVENALGINWVSFLSDISVAYKIKGFGQAVGVFFLFSALVVAGIQHLPKWLVQFTLWTDFVLLVFLSFCKYLDNAWVIAQFLEHAAQFCTPLFLYGFYYKKIPFPRLVFCLKVAIALTFVCHGLYALGYYNRPGYFVDMTIQGFGIQEDTAIMVLNVAGYLDILFSIGLFLPWPWFYKTSLFYIILWGFLTALARVVSNFHSDIFWYSLNQWVPETLYRFPHFLLPLTLYKLGNKN